MRRLRPSRSRVAAPDSGSCRTPRTRSSRRPYVIWAGPRRLLGIALAVGFKGSLSRASPRGRRCRRGAHLTLLAGDAGDRRGLEVRTFPSWIEAAQTYCTCLFCGQRGRYNEKNRVLPLFSVTVTHVGRSDNSLKS